MTNDKENQADVSGMKEDAAPEKTPVAGAAHARKPVKPVNRIVREGAQAGKKKGTVALNTMVTFSSSGTEGFTPTRQPSSHRGEMIISHARADKAAHDVVSEISGERISDVTYLTSMDKNTGFQLNSTTPDPLTPEFELHLIRVPEGEETWQANYLQFVYKQALQKRLQGERLTPDFAAALGRSDLHFTVQPNHEIRLAAAAVAMPQQQQVQISALQFRFTQYHEQYKSMLRVPVQVENPAPITIAVLDTGMAADLVVANPAQIRQTNLVDDGSDQRAIDRHGHGTAMCRIIHDVAPFASLHVFKVFGDHGRTTEWHILNALQMLADAKIVNLSITFGALDEVACGECGHRSQLDRPVIYSHRVRSNVFHNQIRQLVEREGRVLVASAGNSGRPELEYPARFEEVVAVSSVNSVCRRSSFSNYNGTGAPHPNHFAFPGGETRMPRELVGTFGPDERNAAGTSHAAAYATGLMAHLWNRALPEDRNARGMNKALIAAAHTQLGSFATYDVAEHGQGIPGL
jgi:hypothetical protein